MLNLKLPGDGWVHIDLDETDSTMLYLRRPDMLEHPAPFVLVTADYQTAGRGQRGTHWEADAADNLLFGIALRPVFLKPDRQFLLSEVTALTIAEALDTYVEGVSIKWPNDIYVGHRKICGMLLEHDLRGGVISRTIIGPGINVNQRVFRSDAPNPVSLFQLLHHTVSREEVMERFLQRFADYYARLESGESADDIHRTYHERLYRRDGRLHRFRDAGGEFLARLDGVEPDGHLLLIDEAGHGRRYAFKEIQYVLCS